MARLTRLVRFESFGNVDFGECSKVCGVGDVGDFGEVNKVCEVSRVGDVSKVSE